MDVAEKISGDIVLGELTGGQQLVVLDVQVEHQHAGLVLGGQVLVDLDTGNALEFCQRVAVGDDGDIGVPLLQRQHAGGVAVHLLQDHVFQFGCAAPVGVKAPQ